MAENNEELMLLERVFLRIGSANTDEQLESNLAKFLAPILLKLSSQANGVRPKVMELLVHVNKRVKSRPKLLLPVKDLLAQYNDTNVPPFVTNFTILYIKMGFPRLQPSDQVELLPQLLQSLNGRPHPQQNSLMQLVAPTLMHLEIKSATEEHKLKYGLDQSPHIRKLLLDFFFDVIVLPYNYAVYRERAASAQPPEAPPAEGAAAAAQPPAFNGPPPAMSEATFKRALGDNPPNPDDLEKIKLGIVRFIGAELFPQEEVLCHLVVGSADSRHSVATAADREVKRFVATQDWNNITVIKTLYGIFQGTVLVKGKPNSMKPENKRTPSNIQMRLKILPYLLKSREATNQFPACVQLVFDCLYGANTNAKIKHMAVQFVHHLCLHSTDKTLMPIGAVLMSGMVRLISETKEEARLRSLAYVAVGKLSLRIPHLATKDIALLQTFFDAIGQEESENRLAIQEALSMMTAAFRNLEPTNAKLVEALILQNIEKPESQARMMAVQYAKTVFPFNHIPSRYVLLLASGDSKDEVASEASKALRAPVVKKEDTEQRVGDTSGDQLFPSFKDMVAYIREQASIRVKSHNKFVTGNHILPFNPTAFQEVLLYLRLCLVYSAGVTPEPDSLKPSAEQAPRVGVYVRTLLAEEGLESGAVATYMALIKQLLSAVGGVSAILCLLEVVGVARAALAPALLKHKDWIRGFVFSSKEEMRMRAAEVYALVTSHTGTSAEQVVEIKELTNSLRNQALEGQHGSLLCLGYLIGSMMANERAHQGQLTVEDMEVDKDPVDDQLRLATEEATGEIAKLLDSNVLSMGLGACVSLGEIGRRGTLPLAARAEGEQTALSCLVDKLLSKVKVDKEHMKLRERAAQCLGLLCVGDPDFPHRKAVMDGLLDSAAAKQFDLHFTIGESLVCAAKGVLSPDGRDLWLVAEEDCKPSTASTADEVGPLLTRLLSKYCKSANPHVRQAACIWLMTLVKKCGANAEVQKELDNIQAAFMDLLTENDDLTQDIASKGLGVVYENCSEEHRQQLVSTLVETLMSGRKVQQNVTGDTELFKDGALGKTPDGKGMSTYKELCSIANDLNQPDLIYKFMHLANHNAVWNSKMGAAFGFTTIASQAGDQLAPYLDKILPKLYRYQFDPNLKIQQAMTSIWNALVPKAKDTVDKYVVPIMDDLLKNLVSNQWRVRESSCLAVSDLLRGRVLDPVIQRLPELWDTMFRVRDDIKETVRNAADIAVKSLSRASIKLCDPEYGGKVAGEATSLILPCLLKSGLGSQVQEVRAISLSTILKVSRTAGVLLKPHIPLLVVALLESLSTLEPQYLNYVALHAASSQVTQEKLDNARVAASKTSPMMEVVNMCVQYVDDDVLKELIPRVRDVIKQNVGLGTKAGCANLIVSLTHQCPHQLASHSGKLLSVLLNGLHDRNTTVRRSYASAIGHLAKISKDSSVEKLISRLSEWYMEKEDESIRKACGLTLHAINQQAPDVLKSHGAAALPLAFLAMHEKPPEGTSTDKKTSLWEEVWLDATPGSEGGVRLYLTELVDLTQRALQSQSWPMKAQAASAMATMADKLKANLGPPYLGLLLGALLGGLPGRTWTGKNSLLEALATVCLACKDAMRTARDGQASIDDVISALLKEARKDNLMYKMDALRHVTDILEAYEVDNFRDIHEILQPMLAKTKPADDADVGKDAWLEFQEVAYLSLGKAWPGPAHTDTQDSFRESMSCLLCGILQNSLWKVELASLKSCTKFLSRMHLTATDSDKQFLQQHVTIPLLPCLCRSLGNKKYQSIRSEGLSVIQTLLKLLCDIDQMSLISSEVRGQLRTCLETVSKEDSVPELRDTASSLLKQLPNE